MKVLLAGYNLDSEVIEELKKKSPGRGDVTPETLSASYARISRDPRPVDELRAIARREVEKARRSNRNIIFKMGHHSVAEHAVFNFDIIGVSRLATEEIEKFRLVSYTEKSQRYQRLKDNFIVPEEIKRARREKIFSQIIRAQNALYHSLYEKIKPCVFKEHKELRQDAKEIPSLEGRAKEDARYILSLATLGQLGMTLNARNLELLIRRFAANKLEEIRELNRKIYSLAQRVAPSIILFVEASEFDKKTYGELEEKAQKYMDRDYSEGGDSVTLVDSTPEADEKVVASLLHTSTQMAYKKCLEKARGLKKEEKKEFIKTAFKYMEFFDSTLREFEYVSLTFNLVISASCFAQLKRHRMATLTAQPYNPDLGVTVPLSIEKAGEKKAFMKLIEETNRVHRILRNEVGQAADYVLTNAHRRRVLLKVNLRELYHLSRLREDATAQWEIRSVARKMSQQASSTMPLASLLLGGKDVYPSLYRKLFGRNPKLIP
ncbi:MAG: FAD-dependent thymidylate synthase [Candidatus Aminicenantales bacterium]